MTIRHKTREAWLEAAIAALRPTFEALDLKLPTNVKVSCGWPAKTGGKAAAGWCYKTAAATDGATHIFVNPVVDQPITVLAILGHELIHAHDDCASGHSGAFRAAHKALGFTGKATACTPGEALKETFRDLAGRLGDYPHKAMAPYEEAKKQTTRMVKVVCPGEQSGLEDDAECGYTVRTTRKWLDALGPPICPCGQTMVADIPDEEEGE